MADHWTRLLGLALENTLIMITNIVYINQMPRDLSKAALLYLRNTIIHFSMMIGAEAQYVFHNVWAIVGITQGPDVMALGVIGAVGKSHGVATKLASVAVKGFYFFR
jgi:hypothetical protein